MIRAKLGDHLAGRDIERGEQVDGAVAFVFMRAPWVVVGIIGSIGAVRFNAWIWGFSSTANTAALTGGFMYSPTMSRIWANNCGSGEILNSSRERLRSEWNLTVESFSIE